VLDVRRAVALGGVARGLLDLGHQLHVELVGQLEDADPLKGGASIFRP
jgi:hypothetical protein